MPVIKVKLPSGEIRPIKFPDDWDEQRIEKEIHNQFPVEDKSYQETTDSANQIKSKHPFLYKMAEKIAQNPMLSKTVQGLADSPIAEASLSAGTSLINAIKNMANLAPFKFDQPFGTEFPTISRRSISDEPIAPLTERGFPEPKDLTGQLSSLAGSMVGTGIGFAAAPGSTTIPGALATGFAQGEGGIGSRSLEALLATLIPGSIHVGKAFKSYTGKKAQEKLIGALEREKTGEEANLFQSKEDLANKLTNSLEKNKSQKQELIGSLEKFTGKSESLSKKELADSMKKTKKEIFEKYDREYNKFNQSAGGKTEVKKPIDISNFEKEYNLSMSDLSPDTRDMVKKFIGEIKETKPSEDISVITGKPIKEGETKVIKQKPTVSNYIDLWKQVRSEIADFKKSSALASTPAERAKFRKKAEKLQKFSSDLNEKAFSSLNKKDAEAYKKLQEGYLKERVPFSEESLLEDATSQRPKIPDNFFKKLNESGMNDLVATIKSNHPDLVEAIAKHDLKNIKNMSTQEIKSILEGDLGRFLPKGLQDKISGLHTYKEAEELLKNALGKVQSAELTRKVRASDINEIIKRRPDLQKPFKNIADKQKKIRELKKALLNEGYKLKDIEAQLKKYKTGASLLKTSLVPVAGYAGVKSKRSPDNED